MTSIEDRFKAAVNVIKGLPKNGPYQPSTAMMLKFYGCYKQATEGDCIQKKPAFWDVVGKAKWDAWKANSHLTKQQAMQKYVDDLREIIETMSFTDNVADFVGSIGGLDNINLDELDMVAPGMRKIAESHPNSPFNSRTNSPQHGASSNAVELTSETAVPSDEHHSSTSSTHIYANPIVNNAATLNGHQRGTIIDDNDDDNDGGSVFAAAPITKTALEKTSTNYSISTGTVDQSDDEYGDPVDIHNDLNEAVIHNNELLKQIQATVVRMNTDLLAINKRISALERGVYDIRSGMQQRVLEGRAGGTRSQRWPEWWPFRDISPAWFALLVLWPFLLNRVGRMLMLQRKRY